MRIERELMIRREYIIMENGWNLRLLNNDIFPLIVRQWMKSSIHCR